MFNYETFPTHRQLTKIRSGKGGQVRKRGSNIIFKSTPVPDSSLPTSILRHLLRQPPIHIIRAPRHITPNPHSARNKRHRRHLLRASQTAPSGTSDSAFFSATGFSSTLLLIGVAIAPGAMLFTLILYRAPAPSPRFPHHHPESLPLLARSTPCTPETECPHARSTQKSSSPRRPVSPTCFPRHLAH